MHAYDVCPEQQWVVPHLLRVVSAYRKAHDADGTQVVRRGVLGFANLRT